MPYENAIMLGYVGFAFIFMYAAFQIQTRENKFMRILQVWFFVVAFLLMINGITAQQNILDEQNYTTTVINETVYSALTTKHTTSYKILLWTFIFTVVWFLVIMLYNLIQSIPKVGK